MHTSTYQPANRARSRDLQDDSQLGGAAADVRALRALLVRPGKRKSQALTARLDAVRQRMLDLN